MKGFFLILAVLLVMFALVFAATTPAVAGNGCGNCNNFGSQGFGGFHGQNFNGHFHSAGSFGGFGFHGQNFNPQNFYGQNFQQQNFNRPRVQGNNGVLSAGGRALVFVGRDRNGNPVFR